MKRRKIGVQAGEKSQKYDIDIPTYDNSSNSDKPNGCYGRRKIFISVSEEEFLNDPAKVLNDNISDILSAHNENIKEMRYLEDVYKGKHDILDKVRANHSNNINNKSVTNYPWHFVNFKKGYYVGIPINYVDLQGAEKDYEDMKYLNLYNRAVFKPSLDMIKYEHMLITGIAYTMTIPRRKNYNPEEESPYEYIVLNNEDVCVVRSRDIFNTKLFTLCISSLLDEERKPYNVYTMYYGDNVRMFKDSEDNSKKVEEIVLAQNKMPIEDCITEYQLNEQRMGIFEIVLNNIDTLDKINSNRLDQQEECTNSYLTFENVDISQVSENIDEFRAKRMIAVKSVNRDFPAKVGSIILNEDNGTIDKKYNDLEERMYNIIGVPMATSNTGKGVSGEAQNYGGGWRNAQIMALVDTAYIEKFELEDLVKFVKICHNSKDDKLKNLIAYNIAVKYTINKSDNMQSKAQSMKYFIDAGFTREQALMLCEITDDPQTQGSIADENYEKQKRMEIDFEVKKKKELSEMTVNLEEKQPSKVEKTSEEN